MDNNHTPEEELVIKNNLLLLSYFEDMCALFDKPKLTFKEQLSKEFTDASYRVASTQLLTIGKNLIVQQMRNSSVEDGKIRFVADFLDTELGQAFIGMFIGATISQLSQLNDSSRTLRLLKEFRVSGMTTVGNEFVEALLVGILPTLTNTLSDPKDNEEVIEQEETEHHLRPAALQQ